MMTSFLDAALYYSKKEFSVFPLLAHGKLPAIKSPHPKGHPCIGECGQDGHGFHDATSDPDKITHWWTNGYSACNIGIATGKSSGFVAMDIDPGHDGKKSLEGLTTIHGPLPVTPIAHTGGGGSHYLFDPGDVEIRNSQSILGPGIDFRGDGGYIAASPSIHPNGKPYYWDTEAPLGTPIAPLPAWIIEILTTKKAPPNPSGLIIAPDENVYPPGTRHQAFTSLAGTMRRRGMSENSIYQALMEENKRCIPPHDEKEVRHIAQSVCKYEPNAALATIKLGRLQAEWAFCKSIYEHPINLSDFEWVQPGYFGDKTLASFWAATLEARDTVAAATRSNTLADLQAWKDYNPDRVDAYAKEIARYGYLDGIGRNAANLQRLASEGDISKVSQAIQALSVAPQIATVSPQDAETGLSELAATLETGAFIKTGVGNIDQEIGGLEMGAESILAARPSTGKTTLAWQIARNVALSERVLFFSLENKASKIWEKAALGIAEVTAADIFNKSVSRDKLDYIYNQVIPDLKRIYQGRLYLYDQITDTDIMWRMVVQLQPALVIIDHMRYIDNASVSEIQRLGMISKRGKQLAVKTGCHVMFLHQLSRALTARDDKSPQLTDLRESGHIEENADQVFMLHRPAHYGIDTNRLRYSETQLLTRKNRNGVSGVPFGIYYDLAQQWFYRRDEIPENYKEVCLDGKLQRSVNASSEREAHEWTDK